MEEQIYLCIDLKSFYASVECVERDLDPLTTNLAVADPERSEKTICLAISPIHESIGSKEPMQGISDTQRCAVHHGTRQE